MKTVDVYGLGNALVDILVKTSEADFQALDLEKATMRLVSHEEQSELLARVTKSNPQMASAGSVANTIYSLGQLGGKAAFSGSVGDDRYGLFYKNEFEGLGILFPNAPTVGAVTGTCLVFITPDAERTMRTSLAVSTEFGADHIDEALIAASKYVFIEGYLLANPGKVEPWLQKVIPLCKKHNTKIAFTCSEAWVIQSFRPVVDMVLDAASVVFANESEAIALTEAATAEEAFNSLKKRYESVAITVGEKGALVSLAGDDTVVSAFPCKPIDLTGAGDVFAGGIMYGLSNGFSAAKAATAACFLASKVIEHVGARYPGDLKMHWKEALEKM